MVDDFTRMFQISELKTCSFDQPKEESSLMALVHKSGEPYVVPVETGIETLEAEFRFRSTHWILHVFSAEQVVVGLAHRLRGDLEDVFDVSDVTVTGLSSEGRPGLPYVGELTYTFQGVGDGLEKIVGGLLLGIVDVAKLAPCDYLLFSDAYERGRGTRFLLDWQEWFSSVLESYIEKFSKDEGSDLLEFLKVLSLRMIYGRDHVKNHFFIQQLCKRS